MIQPPSPIPTPIPTPIDRRAAAVGIVMLAILGLLGAGLVALVLLGGAGTPGGTAEATPDHTSFVYAEVRPAPTLELNDQDGNPFSLASLRGQPVLVFFGYTHCPDVCPTSLTDLRAGIRASGVDATVVFVTVDPTRDDAAAMKQYVDYYAAGFIGLTGTETEIAEAAAAWGISYRKLESGSASGYAMAHSAEAYLVDAEGTLRHHLFFGTPAELIADRLRQVAGE